MLPEAHPFRQSLQSCRRYRSTPPASLLRSIWHGLCQLSIWSESCGPPAKEAVFRHRAIAALLQAEYIPPPLKSGYPCLGRSSICSFRWSVVTARLFPSPKVAAFLLSSQCEPSPSAADVPNRRGYLFRLQACSDRPQGCVPRISPLARRCQNDAAGGEVTSKAGVSWDTSNGTPKPKQVSPPDKNGTRPRSHTPILFTICCGFSRIRGSA